MKRIVACHSFARRPARRTQGGLVLFIALIVMVALALAAIALIRSTDATMLFSGNVAFKKAASAAVDRSVEQSIHALFDIGAVSDRTVDCRSVGCSQNYYAAVPLNADSSIPEIPAVLLTKAAFTAAGLDSTLVPDDEAGNQSRYVIERMCRDPGPALGSNCNLASAAYGADPGTQHYTGLIRPGDAYYRVTVRVEGPRNTVVYGQALLQ